MMKKVDDSHYREVTAKGSFDVFKATTTDTWRGWPRRTTHWIFVIPGQRAVGGNSTKKEAAKCAREMLDRYETQ